MAELPTLTTQRLTLRSLCAQDATRIQLLANDKAVAATTRRLPSPYTLKDAQDFLEFEQRERAQGQQSTFAIVLSPAPSELIGVIGLGYERGESRAELGYWLGQAYWGQGYATEATIAILRYGFEIRGLNRIFAHCMCRNPASSRVLQKAGMQHEGCLRQHYAKWGKFEDINIYGILASEWRK